MARQPSVPQAVRQFLEAFNPSLNGMIVAVSGGADSIALLRALCEVGVAPLLVAHINHGLRGVESEADEAFVAETAASINLPFRVERRNLRQEAIGDNLEAAARNARYGWLARLAESEQCAWVATGHTADDQAETVLFRLLRGTGITGLAGVRPSRILAPGVHVIRPLLRVSRASVIAYLQGIGQTWREDSSNADRRLTRNRIRHELLPLLRREYNPRVSEVLAGLGEQAAQCRRITLGRTLEDVKRAELPRAGQRLVFRRSNVESLSQSTLVRFWNAVWQRERWPMGNMGRREYERIARWCRSTSTGLELPDRIGICRFEHTIVAGPGNTE